MLGTQLELNNLELLTASKTNLIVPSVPSLETANGSLSASENLEHWATRGYFEGSLIILMKNILLKLTPGMMEHQGSRKKIVGDFSFFSLGWNVNKESF